MRGGFIGVDVFFVLSGFLITTLLATEYAAKGSVSLRQFYARRARRLLPASGFVIVATVIAGRIWLEPLRLRDLGSDAVASAGFFANITFALRGTDYLQSSLPPSALQHFWSLAVEEQFYVVWPTLLLLLFWSSRRFRHSAVIGIAMLSVTSLALSIWQTNASQQWAFFGLHTRAWELGLGALLALSWKNIERLPQTLRAVAGWMGLGGIAASCFVISENVAFPSYAALLPVVASALVLGAGDNTKYGPQMILRAKPLQFIGARSYSIYLWHWPALVIGEAAYGHALTAIERIIVVGVAVIGACLSHHFLENPIRHSRVLSRKPNYALAMGAMFIVAGLAAGIALQTSSVTLATDEVAAEPIALATTSTSTVPTAPSTTIEVGTTVPLPPPTVMSPALPLEALAQGVTTEVVPANLDPSLRAASGDKPIVYDHGCHLSVGPLTPKKCEFGDKISTFTVALFGDSHAAQWFPTIQGVAKTNGWRFLPLTKSGCPPIDFITYNRLTSMDYPQCRPWRKNVIEMMTAEKVSVVFITWSNKLLSPQTRNPFTPATVEEGYAKLIPELQAAGITPILITDTPYPGENSPVCLSKNIKRVANCVFTREKGFRAERIQAIIDAGTANNTQVLNVSNWFCAEKDCPAIIGNLLVYRDADHMTTKYAQWLVPVFDAAVSPYVNWVRQRTSVS